MVLVKDNHWLSRGGAGAVQQAIDEVRSAHPEVRVELEADRLEQVEAFLDLQGVDVILLDNMSLEDMRSRRRTGFELARQDRVGSERRGESRNIVRAIAATGVDFISCGALTHSAPALDLSLELAHVV